MSSCVRCLLVDYLILAAGNDALISCKLPNKRSYQVRVPLLCFLIVFRYQFCFKRQGAWYVYEPIEVLRAKCVRRPMQCRLCVCIFKFLSLPDQLVWLTTTYSPLGLVLLAAQLPFDCLLVGDCTPSIADKVGHYYCNYVVCPLDQSVLLSSSLPNNSLKLEPLSEYC